MARRFHTRGISDRTLSARKPKARTTRRARLAGHSPNVPWRSNHNPYQMDATRRYTIPVRRDSRTRIRLALPHRRPRRQRDDATVPSRPLKFYNPLLFFRRNTRTTQSARYFNPHTEKDAHTPSQRQTVSFCLTKIDTPRERQIQKR